VKTSVGSAICAELEGAAKQAGISLLSVDANEGARPLFERQGFKADSRNDFTIGGVGIHNYRMLKPFK